MSKIHPVFHGFKLAPYRASGILEPPPLMESEGELEYKIENVLDKTLCKVRLLCTMSGFR